MDYRQRVRRWNQSLPRDDAGGVRLGDVVKRLPSPVPKHNDTWGEWKYDAKRLVLVYRENTNDEYEVDVRECIMAQRVVDWIGQINEKTWATVQCIGQLARALDDLLDLRGNLAHLPPGKSFDVRGYLSK